MTNPKDIEVRWRTFLSQFILHCDQGSDCEGCKHGMDAVIKSLLSEIECASLYENELALTWLGDIKKALQKEKTRLKGQGVDLRLKPIWQEIHKGIFAAHKRREAAKGDLVE